MNHFMHVCSRVCTCKWECLRRYVVCVYKYVCVCASVYVCRIHVHMWGPEVDLP